MKSNSMKELKLIQISNMLQQGVPSSAQNIGRRLRDIREALGMTQKQLAKRTGIKQPVISRIEENSGNCTLKTIIRIAKALNCDFQGFFSTAKPLEEIVKEKYLERAGKLLQRVDSNMAMEKQSPNYSVKQERKIQRLTEDMQKKKHSGIWDE